MLFYEVKDTVREHLSRTTFPTDMLDKALANGRRIVEQAGNWYWMRADTFFTLVVGQHIYPINSSGQAVDMMEVTGFASSLSSSNASLNTSTIKLPTKFLVQPIDVPGFKDIRAALVKRQTDSEWSLCEAGGVTREEADLHFAINDRGQTELIHVDNFNLLVYPPFPNEAYAIQLYYW